MHTRTQTHVPPRVRTHCARIIFEYIITIHAYIRARTHVGMHTHNQLARTHARTHILTTRFETLNAQFDGLLIHITYVE